MYLKRADSERFLRLISIVEDYVASIEEVDLDGPEEDEIDAVFQTVDGDQSTAPVPIADESSDDRRTLRALAYVSHVPDVIDRLLEDESRLVPGLLDARDRRVLRQWREGAWEVEGVLLGFAANGDALFETPLGVVEICGITHEIADFPLEVPGLVSTVLLPIGERITYARSLLTYDIAFGPGIRDVLEESLHALERGETAPIATAPAFVKRLRTYRVEKREEDFAELEREARRARGEDVRTEGMHRSVLVGMDEEEREAAIDADLDMMLADIADQDELILNMAKEQSVEGTPADSLRSALAELDDDELLRAVLLAGIKEEESGTANLVDATVKAFEDPMTIREFLLLSHDFEYRAFRDIVAAGGRIEVAEDDLERLKGLYRFPPFLFLYHDISAGTFVNVVYDEVSAWLSDDLRDEIEDARLLATDVIHCAEVAAELYGLIPADEFADVYASLSAGALDRRDTVTLLQRVLGYQDRDYCIESIDGTLYLAEPFLSVDFVTYGGEEEVPRGLVEFQHHIIERQKTVPRRPLRDVVGAKSLYDWTMGLESARILRDWLDNHVPDDDSDYGFSERVMEELYDQVRMPGNPTEAADIIADCYADVIFEDDPVEFFNEVLGKVFRFTNDVPLWQNHGYSPTELHELETGRRQFFNPDGTPMKVGRNDPCPCGSGKKYKNCHGRPRGRVGRPA